MNKEPDMVDVDALESNRDVAGLNVALGDENWATRARSARALGRLGAKEAIGPLSEALRDSFFYDPTEDAEDKEQIREWALEEVYPVREAARKALKQILTSERGAMPDTFAMKREGDVEGLIRALRYGRDDAALQAGREIDDPELAALVTELTDDAWRCRKRAAEAVENPRAVEPLIEALGDPRSEVRMAAITALRYCDRARAVEPIIGTLQDESYHVREGAAWELGALRDPRAVEPLILALQDWTPDVRRRAAWALGLIGGDRAIEALTAAASDPDESVRKLAEEALDDAQSASS